MAKTKGHKTPGQHSWPWLISGQLTSFPAETGLLQSQLAHLHVVDAGHEQDGLLIRMQLHLATNPIAVKVGIPPALVAVAHFGAGLDEGDLEVALGLRRSRHSGYDGLDWRGHWGAVGLFQDRCRGPHVLVKGRVLLLVLGLPGMVDFESAMKLFSTGLQQLNITAERGVISET